VSCPVQFRVRRNTPTAWWDGIDTRQPLNREWTFAKGLELALIPLPQSAGSNTLWDLAQGNHVSLGMSGSTWRVQNTRPVFNCTNSSAHSCQRPVHWFRSGDRLTVAGVVRHSSGATYRTYIGQGRSGNAVNRNFQIRFWNSTNLEFIYTNTGSQYQVWRTSTSSIDNSIFNHIVVSFVYGSGVVEVFVNGEPLAGGWLSGNGLGQSINAAPNGCNLGVPPSVSVAENFAGDIANILLWKDVRPDPVTLYDEWKQNWPNAFNRRRTSSISLPASPGPSGRVRIYGGIGKQLIGGAL